MTATFRAHMYNARTCERSGDGRDRAAEMHSVSGDVREKPRDVSERSTAVHLLREARTMVTAKINYPPGPAAFRRRKEKERTGKFLL